MKYRVWDHDNEDRGDAREISAGSIVAAAELFAERYGDDGGYYPREIQVTVLDGEGRYWAVCVTVEMRPEFRGDKPEEVEPDGCTFKGRGVAAPTE